MQWRYFYGSFDDNLFNTTRTVSNGTNVLMICFDSLENIAIFTMQKVNMFPDFTSMIMAFFQNMLGSITQMINIYKNLQNAIEKGDLTPVFLEMGKIFRIIIDFEPIDLSGY